MMYIFHGASVHVKLGSENLQNPTRCVGFLGPGGILNQEAIRNLRIIRVDYEAHR